MSPKIRPVQKPATVKEESVEIRGSSPESSDAGVLALIADIGEALIDGLIKLLAEAPSFTDAPTVAAGGGDGSFGCAIPHVATKMQVAAVITTHVPARRSAAFIELTVSGRWPCVNLGP